MIHFQDENMVIATKKQGILVQGDKSSDEAFIDIISREVHADVHLINRLDRGVGGLVLLAKNKIAAGKLNEIEINKKYLAVVTGIPKERDLLEDYLLKNQRLNISKVVDKGTTGGKLSFLEYERKGSAIYKNIDISLLEISLKTGRHHQIRVQLSSRGFGILGDDKYNRVKIRNVPNIGLWSYEMEFINPFTGNIISIVSNPEDIFPFNLF